ncbi:Maf family protein [Wenxinia marina]|uniref:Nucleoside triphosphate pyrophosphatase n=1 Tax=Wenxinia marina DSM 24838 TaxID=1123501 RepID=A0A0D0QFI2_9RHOB|nr:nucleoside triphosphate pyrophosphatase [Wenxinia marina]KIQ71062.1 MAF protein [Wenxinia marina DSM 24838]GGL55181.1 Maf-like protein [Wenxinia marina]
MPDLVLASGSPTRADLLSRAGVTFDVDVPRLDEATIRDSLAAGGASPREIANALAEAKALRISARRPEAFVLGSDQVLDLDGRAVGKPEDEAEAVARIREMRGRTHRLQTAAAIALGGEVQWRHVTTVRLTMADRSDDWIAAYVSRNWPSIAGCAGGYQVEAEGIRLFSRIEGDYFAILGLPLLEVLTYLTLRNVLSS